MEQREIKVGKAHIAVESEDFLNGYQAGILACSLDKKAFAIEQHTITDDEITSIIMERIENSDYPDQYNVGYCMGWIVTMTCTTCTTTVSGGGK